MNDATSILTLTVNLNVIATLDLDVDLIVSSSCMDTTEEINSTRVGVSFTSFTTRIVSNAAAASIPESRACV